MAKGKSTSWILRNKNLTMASNDQIAPVGQESETSNDANLPSPTALPHGEPTSTNGTDKCPEDVHSDGEPNVESPLSPPPSLRRSTRVPRKVHRYEVDS